MNPQDENIQFDDMTNWEGMFSPQVEQNPIVEEKEYPTLYEELVEKCDPAKFVQSSHFNEANQLYSELMNAQYQDDAFLRGLRNQAIQELGIHISTRKKYEYLKKFFEVSQYTRREIYDKVRVEKAQYYFTQLEQAKEDILALEMLENEAMPFINQRKAELETPAPSFQKNEHATDENPPDPPPDGTLVFLLLIVLIGILVSLVLSTL